MTHQLFALPLFVENSYGSGTVAVAVSEARDGAPPVDSTELTFRVAEVSFDHSRLAVGDLPQGSYTLRADLRSRQGGRVGYALVQSNGLLTWAGALLVGLSASAVLALVALLLTMRSQQTGL